MSWHGKFVWYELMARDLDAAARFYTDVLGWGSADSGMPGVDYRMFTSAGANQGGLMAVMEGGPPPGWLGYVAVDDCDAAAAQAKAAGATVHRPPFSIPNVGRVAIFADPQGALLAMIQPTPAADGQQGAPQAGWHDLRATDGDAAWAFHSALFGWEERRMFPMGPGGLYRIFGAKDAPDCGGMLTATDPPVPAWLYYFTVAAITPALEQVTAGGGTVHFGPAEVPGGLFVAMCGDPDGATFGLVASER